MSDPHATPSTGDEPEQKLELDAELVQDLEPDQQSADVVRGGPCQNSYGGHGN